MKRTDALILLLLSTTIFYGCESTQKADSIPATPLIPAESAEEVASVETPPTPLSIGDAAPTITIDHWVKGDPIDGFADGQVYVLEFWATWCGPCVTSMPHLSALQDTYGDAVKIIGVSSEKELETVTNFLDQTNKKDDLLNTERMRYTVTVDPDRSTSRAYMEASGQRGIPTAFIIDANGTVAWIGHPMRMDEPLEQIVNGTWDLAAATAQFEKEHAQDRAMMEMRTTYAQAMQNEDWDMWIAAIDNFTDTYGSNDQMNSMKFDALLNGKQDAEAAYAWARVMLEASWDDPQTLNAYAWKMLDETPDELKDLDFALEIATRASALTNNEDAAILDTLARAYWELGDTDQAIAWQEKAVSFAEEPLVDDLAATLARYQNYDPIAEEMVAVAAEPTPEHTPEGTPELASEPEPAPEPELQPLAVGDTAPEISIDHWVKGDPIEGFDEGKVYVMEFWATWCGPCVTSMPHLSALQDTYGDAVKIIGVSSEKELETVTNFLDQTNKKDDLLNTERMRYTVTVDPDRSTSRAYMEASGQRGIPTAFIIDANGTVAWIGHPMRMDEPLEQIVNGTWDLAAATATFAQEQAQQAAMDEMRSIYNTAMENEDWDMWIAAIDNFTDTYGSNDQMNSMKFDALLNGKQDAEAAYAWARVMLADSWDDPFALNAFAWNILDETPSELQNLEYALEVAIRACELTNNEDPMILDTLARAYWELGETYKAIAWQQKAVAFAEEGEMGDEIASTLKRYELSLASVTEE